MSLCFSSCSLLQRQDSTLHTLTTIQSFSVFLKQRHFKGKYITTSHHYICHDTQVCDRSYDYGICGSFKFVGKEPMKSNLGLTSVLEIDTSFVPALTSSLGLEGRSAHTGMELLLLRVGRSQSKPPVCSIINYSNSNQLITQNQLIKL